MKVLDIDLDVFLNRVAYNADPNSRLDDSEYHPWSIDRVVKFLEENCGLSKNNKIPGKFGTEHYEAFFAWKDQINSNNLVPPFDVIHVDAHADLGLGDAGWVYLMGNILHRPVNKRNDPELGFSRMNSGNFLSYAIGCRWLSSLKYVHHQDGANDLIAFHFKDWDVDANKIQLKMCNPSSLRNAVFGVLSDETYGVVAKEPEIEFEKILIDSFKGNGDYSYITVSHSLAFTPPKSDALIPVIMDYILSI